jgi:hypothetical protein
VVARDGIEPPTPAFSGLDSAVSDSPLSAPIFELYRCSWFPRTLVANCGALAKLVGSHVEVIEMMPDRGSVDDGRYENFR